MDRRGTKCNGICSNILLAIAFLAGIIGKREDGEVRRAKIALKCELQTTHKLFFVEKENAMKKMSVLISAVVLVLFGCVPSLHELYTKETLVFDPALAGKWQGDSDEIWEFVPDAKNKAYALTIRKDKDTDNKKDSKLIAHLVDVKGQRFLDLYPAKDAEIETGDWTKMCIVPAHLFLHVAQTEPNLVLAAMDPDKIGDLLEQKPDRVKHERIEDRDVLTDTPERLQAFVTAGLAIEKFYGDPMTLKRAKPADPNTASQPSHAGNLKD